MGERSPSDDLVFATGKYSVEQATAGTAGAGLRGTAAARTSASGRPLAEHSSGGAARRPEH